ncbi:hypothetical protein SDC9_129755 [bioreactor metagenome]|uniref:Uncharacterized protein n=1 Tax=bioreactor metagenome TaxID=1076179 RepID=A0A645D0T8_9ZZZZ
MMKAYRILLNQSGEGLSLEGESDKKYLSVNHLMITSALIESFYSFISENIRPTKESISEARLKLNDILGISPGLVPHYPELLGDPVGTPEEILTYEIFLLHFSVCHWIDLNTSPNFDNVVNPNDTEGNACMYMQNRIIQCPPVPMFLSKEPTRVHEAQGNLLPLAWAEVWYAIENKVRARCCPYCGVVFLLPRNNPRKATCLKPSCKQRYEVDRHGGIEAYREWERNRKKAPSKRPPGRPKKANLSKSLKK